MGMRDAQRRLCIVSLQASLASEIRAAHSAHLVIEPIPEKEGSGSNLEKSGSDIIPTVSPLIIPLLYCLINGFQRAFSVEKPWPGGEKRTDGWASHPVAW
jgi:hypothetical protein